MSSTAQPPVAYGRTRHSRPRNANGTAAGGALADGSTGAADSRDRPGSLPFREPARSVPFAAWGDTARVETHHPSLAARASRLFRMLTWSLAGILASLAIVLALVHLDGVGGLPALQAAAVSMLATSALAYYVALGMLADHLGRNWMLWVGLTLVTKPVGPFVAYLMMRDRVRCAPPPSFRTSQHCMRCGTLVLAGSRLCSACGNPTTAGIAESLRVDAPAMTVGANLHRYRSPPSTGSTRN